MLSNCCSFFALILKFYSLVPLSLAVALGLGHNYFTCGCSLNVSNIFDICNCLLVHYGSFQFQETLGSEHQKVKKSCCTLFLLTVLRLFTNIVVLAFMAGSSFLIYYVSEQSVEVRVGTSTNLLL